MTTEPNDNPPGLLSFPEEETESRERLTALFNEWQASMRGALPSEKAALAERFVWDGFYPCYFRQPLRILFIGRECLGLDGCDYLKAILPAYRVGKRIGTDSGSKHLNSSFFHARMLHIAWGILHGFMDWNDIPWAAKIGDTFATPEGISFAFMNVSKLSNEEPTWSAQWNQINMSVKASGRFIERQIELLKPHVVISMNLEPLFDSFGKCEARVVEEYVERYKLRSGDHESVLINTWHFSAFGKGHVKHFYHPICDAIQKAVADGWIDRKVLESVKS